MQLHHRCGIRPVRWARDLLSASGMAPDKRASRPLSLAHLTVGEVLPPDVPAIAAATGFDSISLRLNSPRPDVPSPPMIGDTAMRRATRRSLSDNGMRLLNIEAVLLRPDTDVSGYAALFESAAY